MRVKSLYDRAICVTEVSKSKVKVKEILFQVGFYNKYKLKPQAFATDYNNMKINNIMIK